MAPANEGLRADQFAAPEMDLWLVEQFEFAPLGGERKLDLAVRLEADEVAFKLVSNIDEAIDAALTVAPSLEVLANYTAFQQYRIALGRVQ